MSGSIFDQGAVLVPELVTPGRGAADPSAHRRGAVDDRHRPPGAALRLPIRLPRLGTAGPAAPFPRWVANVPVDHMLR